MSESFPANPSPEDLARAAAPEGATDEQIAEGTALFQDLLDAYDQPEFPEDTVQ